VKMSVIRREVSLVEQPVVPPASGERDPAVPPGWTPGVCHHDAHVVFEGHRLGLLFLPDDLASVLPCRHVSRDGR
jgi:hypothetical protein